MESQIGSDIELTKSSEKAAVGFYLQHYLSPSMTFIYNQLNGILCNYDCIVLNSRILENTNLFPYEKLYSFRRNSIQNKFLELREKILGKEEYYYISINPFLSSKQNKSFKEILVKQNVKLIHAQFGPSAIEILPLAKQLGLPLVATFHGYDASALLRNEKYIQNLKKLASYAKCLTVSEYMLNVLSEKRIDTSNFKVIHCGISLSLFPYINRKHLRTKFLEKEQIKFLQVSNFVEKKGHKYTIQAFKEFLNNYPNAHLDLAGSGPLENDIKKLVDTLGIQDKIHFHGTLNSLEVSNLMKKADIFLHHSITGSDGNQEGIPTVIMEAMSTGLPVISTYHAGIPEMIQNEYSGFLVKEKDIKDYTNTMTRILSCNTDLGLNARKKIEADFNLNIQNQKLVNIYKDILELNNQNNSIKNNSENEP